MASLSHATDGEITEFKQRLSRAGFTPDLLREINKSPENEMARILYEALMRHPCFSLVHGLFTTPELQLSRMRHWNEEFGWKISDEWFIRAEKTIPVWPEEKLVAVVLVPYLGDKIRRVARAMSGMEHTFH